MVFSGVFSGETEDNAYAKFGGDKQRALWYVMVFSGVVNSFGNGETMESLKICNLTLKPRSHVRILIYRRTWAICIP